MPAGSRVLIQITLGLGSLISVADKCYALDAAIPVRTRRPTMPIFRTSSSAAKTDPSKSTSPSQLPRRTFLKSSGTAAAAMTAASYSQVMGANERVQVACIGVRGRGRTHIREFARDERSEVAAVVDIDQAVAERAAQQTLELQNRKPTEYEDLRKMLEDKSIDAVSVAAPNHWHALATIWSCQAGKDVYVEKPASHSIFEGRKMVEAARKYKRIVQVGHQGRSTQHKVRAIELLRDGVIGKLYMARGLCFKRRKSIGAKSTGPVPPGVNYDIWLGPSQELGFKENRFHYNWHWYWDFGNGDIGNQGVHEMDIARWGLGKEELPPAVYSSGGHYIYPDDQQTPNTQTAVFEYPDSQIVFEVRGLMSGGEADMQTTPDNRNTVGNLFFGADGYMRVNHAGFSTYLGEKHEPGPAMSSAEGRGLDSAAHFANFLDAVKSRKHTDLHCDVEVGHLSAALCHLANISYRTNRKLSFDAKTEKFPGDDEANKLLKRDYREPFVVPEKV